MPLELEGTTIDTHAARRVDDTLVLVREFDDGEARLVGVQTFGLE